MKIAPKIVTRERVFALRWKICIPARYPRGLATAGRSYPKSSVAQDLHPCHSTRDNQRHDAGTVGGKRLDARGRNQDHASVPGVRKRQVNRYITRQSQGPQILAREKAEDLQIAPLDQRHRHRLVKTALLSDE